MVVVVVVVVVVVAVVVVVVFARCYAVITQTDTPSRASLCPATAAHKHKQTVAFGLVLVCAGLMCEEARVLADLAASSEAVGDMAFNLPVNHAVFRSAALLARMHESLWAPCEEGQTATHKHSLTPSLTHSHFLPFSATWQSWSSARPLLVSAPPTNRL